MISNQEYDELMAFMEKHILDLWKHEDEYRERTHKLMLNYTQTGFSIEDIFCYKVDDNTCFYLVYNSIFYSLCSKLIPKAHSAHPEKYSTNNAYNVIEALFLTSGLVGSVARDEYIELLSNLPCYVVYKHNGIFDEGILRIDTFRYIVESDNGGYDFLGGLFHVLKHFSMNDINLSIFHEILNVPNVSHIVYLIAMAFRLKKCESDDVYIAEQELYNIDHKMKYIFYLERVSGVYFLKSCHLDD